MLEAKPGGSSRRLSSGLPGLLALILDGPSEPFGRGTAGHLYISPPVPGWACPQAAGVSPPPLLWPTSLHFLPCPAGRHRAQDPAPPPGPPCWPDLLSPHPLSLSCLSPGWGPLSTVSPVFLCPKVPEGRTVTLYPLTWLLQLVPGRRCSVEHLCE